MNRQSLQPKLSLAETSHVAVTLAGSAVLSFILLACGGTTSPPATDDAGTPDAPVIPLEASADGGDPIDPCVAATTRDIIHVKVSPVESSPIPPADLTFTNFGATWNVTQYPLEVQVRSGGAVIDLSIFGPNGERPAVGTFPQGASQPPPTMHATVANGYCNVKSGTLTIYEMTSSYDTGAGVIQSMLFAFDVMCTGYSDAPDVPLQGCVKYAL